MTLRDAKHTAAHENELRAAARASKKQEHQTYLHAVIQHSHAFRQAKEAKIMGAARVARMVAVHLVNKAKDKVRAQEQDEIDRMKLLMEQDEAGYRALIDKKKHKRLAFLLEKTDEFMEDMMKSVFSMQEDERRDEANVLQIAAAKEKARQVKAAKEKERRRKMQEAHEEARRRQKEDEASADDGAAADTPTSDATGKVTGAAVAASVTMDGVARAPSAATGTQPLATDAVQNMPPSASTQPADSTPKDVAAPEGVAAAAAVQMSAGSATGEAAAADTQDTDGVMETGASKYGAAHKITERVTKQPVNMVFGTLKEYQMTGLEWLVSMYNNKLNGILADEMGLGKTIQTIALVTHLVSVKKDNGPYLIIVPLSTLSNWVLEFERWAPTIKKIIYRGTPPVRKNLHQAVRELKYNVLLTTYDYVMKDKHILGKVHWRFMIIDEGHRMKNARCKLTVVLSQEYMAPRRLLLTGTPLQNNLTELWGLLNFLLPSIFKSSQDFSQWFSAPFSGAQTETIEMNEEEKMLVIQRLHKVLRPFVMRRLKKEVETQLPDKVEHIIKCKMSAVQQRLYTHAKKYGVLLEDDSEEAQKVQKGGGVSNLRNTIMQLRKICNSPLMFKSVESGLLAHLNDVEDGEHLVDLAETPDFWRSGGKFELLDRVLPKLKATGHKVLIFCQMTVLMSVLEDYLISANLKYMRLDGSTKADDRGDLLKQFNAEDSDFDVFILSTRAGGLGLNLQSADTVIIFDSDWNPHQDLQAQDRAHRIGQKNEVRVLRLVTINSVEEHILETARFKLNMDDKVIQAGKFNNSSSSAEQRAYLMAALEKEADGDDDTADEQVDSDDLINTMISRSPQELVLFGKMDEARLEDDKEWLGTRRKSRLMEEHELPRWMLKEDHEVEVMLEKLKPDKIDLDTMGRGNRERNKVSYADQFTEHEWLEAVDNGNIDNLEEDSQKKKERRKKREAEKLAREAEIEAKKERTKTRGKRKRGKGSGKGKGSAKKSKGVAVTIEEESEDEDDEDGNEGALPLTITLSTKRKRPSKAQPAAHAAKRAEIAELAKEAKAESDKKRQAARSARANRRR